MTRPLMACPASILLFTLSIPAAGQSLFENPETAVAPRVGPSHQQQQAPADTSVIVVRPELTDEQPALAMALKYYERASKADPPYADAQNNIGTIWYQRKKYGKAIKAYQKAIGIRNDMAVLYSNLAYAYFGDKKYEQAIGSFRQARALDPQLFEHNSSRNGSLLQDRSVSDRGRFYYLLAKSFAEAGNLERCLIYLRKAKDEGYKELSAAKTDPSFAAALKDPAIQEVLAPKPPDSTQP